MKTRTSIIIGIPVVLLLAAWFWPLPKSVLDHPVVSTRITDRSGVLLYDVRNGGVHAETPVHEIPEDFRHAVIATEDRTFTTNPGISLRGILRALLHDLEAGKVVEGGSTITQQLVRLDLKPEKRGVLYKMREAWLALKLTSRKTKEEIFSEYANNAFFGQHSYGISAAARTYFDKSPESLSLGECALLGALLNAPTSLNPFRDIAAAKARRSVVLHAMLETKMISLEELTEAENEPLRLTRGTIPIEAPHFVFWLLQQFPELAGRGGEIRTTLDLPLQHAVEEIVETRLASLKDKNVTSAAVVVLDALNGDILAMLGSADYFDAEHDGAVNVAVSPRQPGSALKPFTYALAFSQGMTPASTVADITSQFFTQDGSVYLPRNYDYREHGLVRLREALANSYNIPAVKVLQKVGVERLLTLLVRAGISTLTESPEHYGLALTLGDSEVTLLDLAEAYGIFARSGETLQARALLNLPASEGEHILDANVAWLITDILSDNDARAEEFGRDGPLAFPMPVAAKTGTTRNSRDNWTVGYTPRVIVGVWVGNADNTPMRDTSGITGAGPIFHDVMMEAVKGREAGDVPRPTGIVEREICKLSGLLPTPLCTERTHEFFISGTEPATYDSIYTEIPIDTRNGLIAGPDCPSSITVKNVYKVLPLELRKWARENGWETPPDHLSPLCPGARSGSGSIAAFSITRPPDHTSFKLDPLVPDADEMVIFEGQGDAVPSVEWSVDGRSVGSAKAPDYRFRWRPVPGMHRITAAYGSGSSTVTIEVIQ